jgi:hypothetical protein
MSHSPLSEELAFQEPKKVFVNMVLIPCVRDCEEIIFKGRASEAIRPMRGLIACLDEKAKRDLSRQMERFQVFERNVSSLSRMDVEQLFSEILSYLHENYLKEYGIRPMNPKPKHIGCEE